MPTSPLVVSFADSNYRPLLGNWLRHLAGIDVKRIRVYCLDEQTAEWCAENNVAAELVAWDRSLGNLWQKRIEIFGQLIREGIDFIHSDLDAIWLRNPLRNEGLNELPADLVFSQGTVWPHDVHAQWGFVLCCGWFLAKASPAASRFFGDLATDVRITGDDQISVNRLLFRMGLQWRGIDQHDYELMFRDKAFRCWVEPRVGIAVNANLTVALLPHRQFQRLPEASWDAFVQHFLTPKRCEAKIAALQAWRLWIEGDPGRL